MKIFINPGHMPGVDSGACGHGMHECDVALSIGKLVKGYLEAVSYEVRLLQSDNLAGESPAYPNVTRAANTWDANLFVSIHCNAFNGTARGIETCCYSPAGRSGSLALCIQRQLVDTLQQFDKKIPDRGVKQRTDLAVLKYTDMPAVLVETAFIDEAQDAVLLRDRQDDIARAIARGVTDYFA